MLEGAFAFTSNVDGLRHLCQAPVSLVGGLAGPETVRAGGSVPPPAPSSLGGWGGPESGTRNASVGGGMQSSSTIEPESAQTPTAVAYAHVRSGVSLHDMKRQIEEECIARALAECKGNITKAATLLGMKRPRLSQLVKQYGLGAASDVSEES